MGAGIDTQAAEAGNFNGPAASLLYPNFNDWAQLGGVQDRKAASLRRRCMWQHP